MAIKRFLIAASRARRTGTSERSSAELSEAINSMYRWYENAQVCYAYLHDVLDLSFPVARNNERYATSWPEWFSRGCTLQEMIAPSNVQFFNKTWQHIGDKRTLARISLPKPDSIHANDDEQEDYRSECATGTAKVSDELTVSR